MDNDLETMTPAQLVAEVRKLRAAIRRHRDATGHDLCWHQPDLWALLPESATNVPAVPEWPAFLLGCIRYRARLTPKPWRCHPPLPSAPTAPRSLWQRLFASPARPSAPPLLDPAGFATCRFIHALGDDTPADSGLRLIMDRHDTDTRAFAAHLPLS